MKDLFNRTNVSVILEKGIAATNERLRITYKHFGN